MGISHSDSYSRKKKGLTRAFLSKTRNMVEIVHYCRQGYKLEINGIVIANG